MKKRAFAKVPIPSSLRSATRKRVNSNEENTDPGSQDPEIKNIENSSILGEGYEDKPLQKDRTTQKDNSTEDLNVTDSEDEPLMNLQKLNTSRSMIRQVGSTVEPKETDVSGISLNNLSSITLSSADSSMTFVSPSKTGEVNSSNSRMPVTPCKRRQVSNTGSYVSTPPDDVVEIPQLDQNGISSSRESSRERLSEADSNSKSTKGILIPQVLSGSDTDPNYHEDTSASSLVSHSTRAGSATPTNLPYTPPSSSPQILITSRLDSSAENTPTNPRSMHAARDFTQKQPLTYVDQHYIPQNRYSSDASMSSRSNTEVNHYQVVSNSQNDSEPNVNSPQLSVFEQQTNRQDFNRSDIAQFKQNSNDGVHCVTVKSNGVTSFEGLFNKSNSTQSFSEQVEDGIDRSDINLYRQSYISGAARSELGVQYISEEPYTHHEAAAERDTSVRHPRQEPYIQQVAAARNVTGISQPGREPYTQQRQTQNCRPTRCETVTHAMVDVENNMAAEQLASELVQTFGGTNSHTILSDMLKRDEEQQFMYGGFDRQAQIDSRPYVEEFPAQQLVHDVDLLNTPQQLPPVDDEYQPQTGYVQTGGTQERRLHFGDPQASSTPDRFRRQVGSKVSPRGLQGSYTYNDVHLHGSKWSSLNPAGDVHQIQLSTSFGRNNSIQQQIDRQIDQPHQPFVDKMKQFNVRPQSDVPRCYPMQVQTHGGETHDRINPVMQGGGEFPKPVHEVTKMTFTPRDMMETHLSQHYQNPKQQHNNLLGQPISDVDYSSIYPSREFIERTVGNRLPRTQNQASTNPRSMYEENPPPKKRHKSSRYEASCYEESAPPPPMPLFDDMMAKYPPIFPSMPKEDTYGSRHKYFVVNPSETTEMPPKTLITKYIDFLILENEQITEISKSPAPPVDIYVTEDMYFMDSLKYRVPFPSKKFAEWVNSFYPKLNFREMKFKGRHPRFYNETVKKVADPRPTQQILEDTFYFFQREIMNVD